MTAIDVGLQASDRAANRFRSWRVEVGKDLFGRWNAPVTFGRIGCEGQARRHDFRTEAEVERVVCADGAPPKIGSRFATASSRLLRCCGSSG
jgi:predicted DNA-binding WGR domain protein